MPEVVDHPKDFGVRTALRATGELLVMAGVVVLLPREPESTPTQALLTLVTCHPQYSARQRLILTAELATAQQSVDAGVAA